MAGLTQKEDHPHSLHTHTNTETHTYTDPGYFKLHKTVI